MKDFDSWNGIKKVVEDYGRSPVKTGEVFWCRLGLNIGVEQDGKGNDFMRPVVVIKKFSNQIVLVMPLTTKNHKGDWYVDLIVEEREVQGILNQIRPIDTKRLLSSIEQLSEKEILKIIERYYQLIKEK